MATLCAAETAKPNKRERTMTDDSASPGLALNVLCDMPSGAIEGFVALLEVMLPLAKIPYPDQLAAIYLVRDGGLTEQVNALLREEATSKRVYAPPEVATDACALPVERQGTLRCYVILEERLVRSLSSANYLQLDTTRALLEELLHVRFYSGLWRLGRATDENWTFENSDDLQTICFNALNEYMAIRWKAETYSTVPLIPVQGGYAVAPLAYPVALGSLLDSGGDKLFDTVTGAASGRIPIADAGAQVLQTVYRSVLEPLARESAYKDGNKGTDDVPTQEPAAEASWLYQRLVGSYWERWRQQLRRSFDTFDAESPTAISDLSAMRRTLVEFLRRIGVTYQPLKNSQVYMYFDGTVAQILRQ
jgi:hypothetical protein